MSKSLIHTSHLSEAQSIIEFYNLIQDDIVQNSSIKIYSNEKIILLISQSGKNNTIEALTYTFEHYEINKALSIGIAGCSDSSVKIGTLFCTNKFLKSINFAPITTVDEPLECDEDLQTLLVDMESKYFLQVCKKHLTEVYVFKVVSDYLQPEKVNDTLIQELITDSLSQWKEYI